MKEYLQLLAQRESKVVLGKRFFNLWLLTLVLAAMLVSVAFSNGSLLYLSEKMNDPFTNWVDITNGYGDSKFKEFTFALQEQDNMDHYKYANVQSDHYGGFNFYGKNNTIHYLRCRGFENLSSNLVEAILDPTNVVENYAISRDRLIDESFGFIITKDAMDKLGYSLDSIPAFINYLSYSVGADTLGIELIDSKEEQQDKFAKAPVPVLGVVNRLPGNMDIIASSYFLEQNSNDMTHTFNMNNKDYAKSLVYFVSGDVKKFKELARSLVPDSLSADVVTDDELPSFNSWKKGQIVNIYPDVNEVGLQVYSDIARLITQNTNPLEVQRIFKYETSEYHFPESEYISVNFTSLDSIRAFEKYAKENFNVRIEMSQVNAKENFNDVSLMANILSWAMVVFSIVCIVMFIINMLQSYFQKVKKNIGTFKAFGISSSEMIGVYVAILVLIVFSAMIMALAFVWGLELILPLLGVLKEGEYSYLALWSGKTFWAMTIVMLSTIITVYVVMSKLLSKTPGDLIYDR